MKSSSFVQSRQAWGGCDCLDDDVAGRDEDAQGLLRSTEGARVRLSGVCGEETYGPARRCGRSGDVVSGRSFGLRPAGGLSFSRLRGSEYKHREHAHHERHGRQYEHPDAKCTDCLQYCWQRRREGDGCRSGDGGEYEDAARQADRSNLPKNCPSAALAALLNTEGDTRSEVNLLYRNASDRNGQVAGEGQRRKQAIVGAGRCSVTTLGEGEHQSHRDRDSLKTPGHRESLQS